MPEKKTSEFKIKIHNLSEDLSKEDMEKLQGGIAAVATKFNFSRLAVQRRPGLTSSGDCDCWSYTACACGKLANIINPLAQKK